LLFLDFHTRSTISTALGIGILLIAGFWAAWQSNSFAAGAVAGVVTTGLASITNIIGAAALLAIWHDPQTLAAIRRSKKLGKVFNLPLIIFLPNPLLRAGGDVASMALKKLLLISTQK